MDTSHVKQLPRRPVLTTACCSHCDKPPFRRDGRGYLYAYYTVCAGVFCSARCALLELQSR